MKNSIGLMMISVLLSVSAGVLPARADEAPAASTAAAPDLSRETPLMVIRFNQQHVDYPTPLYNTISKALQVKPSAVFDVISVASRAQEEHNQPYFNRVAEQNTQKVLATLHEIGLPAARISLTSAIDDVTASEVRIYVH